MWWNTGDEEQSDPRFRAAGLAAVGLYVMAGSYCLFEMRGKSDLPSEWFIPDWQIKTWDGSAQAAKKLVAAELWKRVPGGYEFVWIRKSNEPDAIRKRRKEWNDQKRKPAAGEAPR